MGYGVGGEEGDVLRLGETAVRDGGHLVQRREQGRPDGRSAPLDHLHHIPGGDRRPRWLDTAPV